MVSLPKTLAVTRAALERKRDPERIADRGKRARLRDIRLFA